jgi:hypothetical protein
MKPARGVAPKSFTGFHPRFHVPGWEELLGRGALMEAPDMVRHHLITGETGSGKSVSGVMPLLKAILRYPEPSLYEDYAKAAGAEAEPLELLRPAVLVVDPKQELEALVRKEGAGRKIQRIAYGEPGPVLHLFEGWNLDEMDAAGAVDFILQQSEFFVQDQARTDDPIWNLQAASLLKDFVAIDMWAAKRGLIADLWAKIAGELGDTGGYRSFLPSLVYNPANYFKPVANLIAISADGDASVPLAVYLEACEFMKVPGDLMSRIMTVMHLADRTRSSVIWMANGILADLASDEFATCVSLNPIEAPTNILSVEDALRRGDAVIYVPTSTNTVADLIGRCVKSKFFEFAFQREEQARPFFYVVDEAHRFLSSGIQDGEQSLLDRCRAYRAGVVLATQSLASMAYRLNGPGGGHALQIMINNCGNAFYFRTSDIQTQDNLFKRIPNPPVGGRPHVLAVRPLTSLGVGSCYALRANGSWGLFQVRVE